MRIRVSGSVMILMLFAVISAPAHAAERDVVFKHGAVELHGTVMVPDATGKHPAVVFLHGSGPSTREGARPYAEEFAKLGLASLFFDKRGSGKSTGSWTQASLDDLAGDALAAMDFMRTQSEVDPKQVGLWGVSQAGWVATKAAEKSSDIAFMVIICGGGAAPRETELYAYGKAFEKARLSDADKADAFKTIDQYMHYLATGEARAAVVKKLEESKDSQWIQYARLDRILPSDDNRKNWSWVSTWDTAPGIAKMQWPVLLMFGDQDAQLPTDIAVKKWREGLKKAGNEKVTIMVFPGAAHALRVGEHTADGRSPFADGYAESQLGWLWYHVIRRQ